MALWEQAPSGKIFVQPAYAPRQASTTGEALNHKAARMTHPGDLSQSLNGQPGAGTMADE